MVVKYKFGEMSHENLKKMGVDVEFHKIEDMGHEAQPDELNLLGEWLKARLVVRDIVSDQTNATGGKSRDQTAGTGKGKV
jgi:hypothetical protein